MKKKMCLLANFMSSSSPSILINVVVHQLLNLTYAAVHQSVRQYQL